LKILSGSKKALRHSAARTPLSSDGVPGLGKAGERFAAALPRKEALTVAGRDGRGICCFKLFADEDDWGFGRRNFFVASNPLLSPI
jgi:hypothetical protein